jgi:uncharacterized protein YbbK (DUF523 family)/GNAT superfamily N-acetyltransferase
MNILVSACLLGVECRYDGTSALNLTLVRFSDDTRISLIPVCPEVLGGLPVPRAPCERAGDRVAGKDGTDYTRQFEKGAAETLRLARKHGCQCAVLKDRSPSCGYGKIYDGTFSGRLVDGSGVTAELLALNGIRVVGESGAEEFLSGLEPRDEISVRDYRAKDDVDFVISGQLELYKAEFGFDTPAWAAYVTDGVHDLARRFDPERDCLLILEKNGVPGGSIAIVHENGMTAKLRFFFLKPELRGRGAGRKLFEAALDFCRRKKYKRVYLWTFDRLDAARHLYAGAGFRLTETQENDTWSSAVLLEERWELLL